MGGVGFRAHRRFAYAPGRVLLVLAACLLMLSSSLAAPSAGAQARSFPLFSFDLSLQGPTSASVGVPQTYTGVLRAVVNVFGYELAVPLGNQDVRLVVDGVVAATGTTDLDGRYAIDTTFTTAGSHEVQAIFLAHDSAGNPVTFVRSPALTVQVSSGAAVTVSGRVAYDTGGAVQGASVTAEPAAASRLMASTMGRLNAITDADGRFTLNVALPVLPADVNVTATYQAPAMPEVQNSRRATAVASTLDVGTILLPNPQGAEIPLTGGSGQTTDGSLVVSGVPSTVAELFGRTYDPDETPGAFPGSFQEEGSSIGLNSSVFLWIEARDSAGDPVTSFPGPVTLRARVPRTQWADLEDIRGGTDRIEIPIYTFNEASQMWEQQGEGHLEDDRGTVLPEDAEPVILDGTFTRDVFAAFQTTHFSYLNVDYPYIGPWTLSRIDRAKRNTDCLRDAMQLAKRIALSQQGRAAYAKVNLPGADLGMELRDGAGPELANSGTIASDGAWAVYRGDSGGSESQFEVDNSLYDCPDDAEKKKNAILFLAAKVLHESAHWKDDVKKHPSDDGDTPGEEGEQLETDLFGGHLQMDANGIFRDDGTRLTTAERDQFLDHAHWPPPGSAAAPAPRLAPRALATGLEVSVSVPSGPLGFGTEIPAVVTYTNTSAGALRVLNRVVLEGYPLHFVITQVGTGARAPFIGPEVDVALTEADFTILPPGGTLTHTVNLLRDASGSPRYRLPGSGEYDVQAVYEPFFGVEQATSNVGRVTVGQGGFVSGRVVDALTTTPLTGATVRVLQGTDVLAAVQSDSSGNYTLPELGAGSYTVEARAPGYLRNRRANVIVTAGQTTNVNFSLSQLLATGQLRLVLTWGATPGDLDSHLWLPPATPFHVYYGRRGSLTECPFASLDVDDTNGFGPETISITDFFDGTYRYAIHNFSGSPALTASGARVEVFDSSGLIATIDVPTTGAGRWWDVLSVNGTTGAITEINQLAESVEPYSDTSAGCPGASAAPSPAAKDGAKPVPAGATAAPAPTPAPTGISPIPVPRPLTAPGAVR